MVTIQNDMQLGNPNAKDYKSKVLAQLKRENAGIKHGGIVDIDVTGEGFKKDKDKKKALLKKNEKKKK